MKVKPKKQVRISKENEEKLIDAISLLFVRDLMQLPEDQRIKVISPVLGKLFDSFEEQEHRIMFTPEILGFMLRLWHHTGITFHAVKITLTALIKDYHNLLATESSTNKTKH